MMPRDRLAAALVLLVVLGTVVAGAAERDERADELYYASRYAEALELFRQAQKERPDDGFLAYRIYYCLSQLGGKDKEIEKEREKARELLDRQAGQADIVATYYVRFLDDEDGNPRRADQLNALLDAHLPTPDPELSVFELNRLAIMAYHDDRPPEQALTFLRAAMKAEEGGWIDALFLDNLTYIFPEVGEATETLDEFEAALDDAVRRRPESIAVLLARGGFLYELEREEDALRDAQAAAKLGPKSPRDLYATGELYYDLDRYEQAVALLRLSVEQNRFDARAWRKLAYSMEQTGNSAEAAKAYTKAMELDPQNGWTIMHLGLLVADERPEEAEHLLRLSIQVKPDWQRAPRELARFLRDHGSGDQAARARPARHHLPVADRLHPAQIRTGNPRRQ